MVSYENGVFRVVMYNVIVLKNWSTTNDVHSIRRKQRSDQIVFCVVAVGYVIDTLKWVVVTE